MMHVISRKTLIDFWIIHPDAKTPLQTWFSLMENNDFPDFAALKKSFATADRVKPFVVFNIGGNKYRLVAAIHFNRSKIYVRHVLTHKDYDAENWKQ